MKNGYSLVCLTLSFLFGIFFLQGQSTNDTRLLQSPAISETHIAFIYADDLWIADRDGSNPKRLTIDEGIESRPVFSPDGSNIAFSAQYDGNTDAFVIPATGGVPKRLTWHPSWDNVEDFTPDGEHILFISRRSNHTTRHARLYKVGINGGQPEEFSIPTVWRAKISPDGKYIAYNPIYEVFNQWKNYRGGTQARIWILDTETNDVVEIPKPATGGNDAHPNWVGDTVYFRSDRNGEFNLYSFDMNSKAVSQHTQFGDFPISSLTANGNALIFEQGGYLHIYNPSAGNSQKLTVGIATDLLELRPRFVSGSKYIRSAGISPSGARAVIDFRGEIVTVPAEKGDVVNLTQTPGVHEQAPQWSPDGKNIAYFSDESGEYAMHIKKVSDRGVRKLPLNGNGFYSNIHWSPDSKKLCFVDNGRTLYVMDSASGAVSKIATDALYFPGPYRDLFGSWSHDSKWVAYTVITDTNFEQAFVYSIDQKRNYELSDGLSSVSEPRFDPNGKYIYMLASTDAGPVMNWFDQSNQDMEMTNAIYLVTLQKDLVSPLAKENDEEKGEESEKDGDDINKKDKDKGNTQKVNIVIDWQDIHNRILSLPISPGMYSNLWTAEEGTIYYLARTPHSGFNDAQSVMKFTFEDRKAEEVMKANDFEISADSKKMFFRNGSNWGITDVGKKPENGNLDVGAIKVKIDPRKEWRNIFEEAWRVNRDYFYDPNMHGLDWQAIKSKYEGFLDDVVCSSDLYTMMRHMFSEVAVGHHRFFGPMDRLNTPDRVNVGLLGADYSIENGRYRIAKIYGGLNWTPDLRSPLTEPGVNASTGDYILEVDGRSVTSDENFFSFFENRADKIVNLKIGPNADGSNSKIVKVVPIGNEMALRNRDWVEGNIKKVDEATDGQVAYVYVPNTAGAGHTYFKRYFFPQVHKKAIIIDERHNGGGQLADYYIDILKKPYQSSWNFRYGKDLKAPSGSIQGPKVMLIDETAGSGGDYLPWMFRKFGLGTLIGKTTWGGLVGVLGYPQFIDGRGVTAPNVAFYDSTGFTIENQGIDPDIEIEQWPKEVMAGKDPQLEKAIEVILQQLNDYNENLPPRPEYPIRVRKME